MASILWLSAREHTEPHRGHRCAVAPTYFTVRANAKLVLAHVQLYDVIVEFNVHTYNFTCARTSFKFARTVKCISVGMSSAWGAVLCRFRLHATSLNDPRDMLFTFSVYRSVDFLKMLSTVTMYKFE